MAAMKPDPDPADGGGSGGVAAEAAVVVVGAGLAGLTAAWTLQQKHGVDSVLVLEARERPGGRTHSKPVGPNNVRFDLGGQWIGPHQDEIEALAKELGVEQMAQPFRGVALYDIQNYVLKLQDGQNPHFGSLSAVTLVPSYLELTRMTWVLERLAQTVPADTPWTAPDARALDGMTAETWKQQNVFSSYTRDLFDCACRGITGAEPHEISLLHFLMYIRASGGVKPLITIDKGHQERKFLLGAQTVSDRLVERIGAHKVRFSSPVVEIRRRPGPQAPWTGPRPVAVVTAAGDTVWCDHVVIAMPPLHVTRIRFSPPLPAARRQLQQRCGMGAIIKGLLLYKTAFWRQAQLSGEVVADVRAGPVFNVYDETRPIQDKPGQEQPALVTFINGEPARIWGARSHDERKAAILAQLARYFGPEVHQYVHYEEFNWYDDEWSSGAPIAVFATGALSSVGPTIREPVGPIHFAGTETATKRYGLAWRDATVRGQNQGFMDGAVESGKRVAAEIASASRP